MDVQGQGGRGIVDIDGQVRCGVLKIGQFSGASCVSSLKEWTSSVFVESKWNAFTTGLSK